MTRLQIINAIFWAFMGVHVVVFWWMVTPVILNVLGGAIREMVQHPEACRHLIGYECIAAVQDGGL